MDKKKEDTHTSAISMTWATRSKQVFGVDIETYSECGGDVRIIPKALAPLAGQALASIEDPVVIRVIPAHLNKKMALAENILLPDCRASPSPSMDLLV